MIPQQCKNGLAPSANWLPCTMQFMVFSMAPAAPLICKVTRGVCSLLAQENSGNAAGSQLFYLELDLLLAAAAKSEQTTRRKTEHLLCISSKKLNSNTTNLQEVLWQSLHPPTTLPVMVGLWCSVLEKKGMPSRCTCSGTSFSTNCANQLCCTIKKKVRIHLHGLRGSSEGGGFWEGRGPHQGGFHFVFPRWCPTLPFQERRFLSRMAETWLCSGNFSTKVWAASEIVSYCLRLCVNTWPQKKNRKKQRSAVWHAVSLFSSLVMVLPLWTFVNLWNYVLWLIAGILSCIFCGPQRPTFSAWSLQMLFKKHTSVLIHFTYLALTV